ncbi:unnamed protein product [Rotaria sp. Silwood1]|nr:unnamed protein product [Rotaria sp. Silwood1]CAF3464087.1 unnamed protein product [Rotaria sp. Silwood1]CAF3514619.1 unnamed protein product [Rotaria sp. Silwood1]
MCVCMCRGTGGYGQPDGSGGEYWGPEQGHNATVAWLKMGGRRIDTSDDYASRDGIGTGWVTSGVPRSEMFITSKVNPSGYDQALEDYSPVGCPDHAVTLGSTWNPIPDLRKHPSLIAIAEKYSKTPAQIVLRWHWQQGIVVNPCTRDSTHMMENMFIFDFELDNPDMMILSYLNHPMSKMCDDPRLIL